MANPIKTYYEFKPDKSAGKIWTNGTGGTKTVHVTLLLPLLDKKPIVGADIEPFNAGDVSTDPSAPVTNSTGNETCTVTVVGNGYITAKRVPGQANRHLKFKIAE